MRIKIYNKDNTLLTEVTVLEDSVISNEIRGEHTLSLSFSIAEYVDIPEGAYVILNGTTYTLLSQSRVTMNNTRSNEVTAVFEAAQTILSSIRMRNPDDGTLSFSYTATAGDHLALIIANLNRYSNSNEWTVGECVDNGTVKFLQYDYVSCLDALNSIADIFGTEWEISGTTISLHKVEYNISSPLELEYGKMKGLRPGAVRETAARPLTHIYTQGGSRNIDASQYGSTILLLPKSVTFKYDGNKFEDEAGFDNDKARTYTTDSGGTYISSLKNASRLVNEGVIDCTDIYPSATHSVIGFDYGETVPSWVTLNVPENLDYSQYVILGELPTVTFQSGNLQGKTFEIRRNQDGSLAISKEYTELGAFVGWKFMMASVIENGMRLPDLQSGMVPENGDTCKIFGVSLPAEYICDNENKTGASWDMLRRGITYLYEYEDSIFSLKVEIDPIWARTNWEYAVQKFRIGGYVKYINSSWAQSGVMLRIQSIRQGVSNPYSIEIELGNGIVGGGVLKGLEDKISRQAGSLYEQESSQKTLEYNVSNIGGNFVTLDTEQTVTGKKTFANDVIFGGAVSEGVYGKLLIPSTAGPGIYGLLVSDEPVQGETPSESGGLDKAELWLELGGNATDKVIGLSRIPDIPVDMVSGLLGGDSRILPSLLPDWLMGQLLYGGTVDGSSVATVSAAFKDRYGTGGDTVTLNASNASQYEGVYFIASADASSGTVQSLGVRTGDWVVSNGLAWTKIDNTDSVSSVAGLTGVISKAALQTALSDSTHRFVTDAQIASWDGKWAWDEEDIKAVKVNAAVLADKAKALNAARSLWGQSFDGTGDVDGDMSGVGGITMSGSIAGAVNADFSGYLSAGTLYVPYSGGSKIYSLKVSDAPVSGESPSGGGGMDADALWLELGGSSSDKVIAKLRLPEDTVYEGDLAGYALKSEIPSLAGYATQSWVQSQGYLKSVSLTTISDLHSSWDAVLKAQKPAWLTAVSLDTISDLHSSWDALLKATKPTTLAGYGITNAYTQTEVNAKLAAYLPLSGGTMSGAIRYVSSGNRYLTLSETGLRWDFSDVTTGHAETWLHVTEPDGSDYTGMGVYGNADGLYYIYLGGSYTAPWVTLKPSGYVGIGTTSPSYKLHVVGNSYATGDMISSSFSLNGSSGVFTFNSSTDSTWLQGKANKNFTICGLSDTTLPRLSLKASDTYATGDFRVGGSLFIPSTAGNNVYSLKVSDAPVSGEAPSGAGGLDIAAMWDELEATDASKVIDASHIPLLDMDKVSGLPTALSVVNASLNAMSEALQDKADISDIPSLSGYVNSVTTSGAGNAVTGFSKSGNTLTLVKGTTFLTSVPKATSSAYGGIKIGYPESGKNYPVELDSSGRAYVSVPWVDTNTNTTYTLTKSGSTITLTGSDGSKTSVTDSNTTYSLSSFGITATAAEINKLDGVGTLLHSGNIGSYALTPSNYASTLDSRYVKKAGDTMTGPLTITTSEDDILVFNDTASEKYFRIKAKANGTDWGGLVLDGKSSIPNLYLGVTTSDYKVWHSGNDGSGSGLDADLLDGYHGGDYVKTIQYPTGATVNANNAITNTITHEYRWSNTPNNVAIASLFDITYSNDWRTQLFAEHTGSTKLYVRSRYNGTAWGSWRALAFTDSNVASATKLQTSRTIWGRPFDGTGNVSGDMTGVSTITGDGFTLGTNELNVYDSTSKANRISANWSNSIARIYAIDNAGNYYRDLSLGQIPGDSGALYFDASAANWGIGTSSPAYKLDVAGTLRATGGVYVKTLTISSTGGEGHLIFSRANYNYITTPANGYIAFVTNGVDVGSAVSELTIFNKQIFPGTTNAVLLGASSNRWSNVYSVLGNFSGRITAAGLTSSASIVANAGLTTTTLSASGAATLSSTLSVSGLIKALDGVQVGSTDDYGWYISTGTRISAGIGVSRGVNVGSLLVSSAWADYTKVPTNGIYSKGNILSAGNIIAYSSSSRLVKDILPKRTTFSQRLNALGSVVDYRYNNVLKRDKDAHIGLVYENVRDAMPGMCHMHEGYGALNYLDTDYINLVAGAVQEHTDEITRLKNRVAALESEVARLKSGRTAA